MSAALHSADAVGPDVARAMPNAIGPEKSVLSTMLKDPAVWIDRALEEGLTRQHFYLPAHGQLFATLCDLHARGKEIELVSLVAMLHDRGELDGVGGPAAITDIYTYAPNAAHFAHHVDFVKDKHVLREIIRVSSETCAAAFDNPEEVSQLLDASEAALLSIRSATETAQELDTKAGVGEVIRHLERLLNGDDGGRGVPTGYPDLDRMCKGLKPGEMFVVAARPSMGKTSLMMNIAERICIDQGVPSLVFSCEMTAFQILQRLVYSRARFAMSALEKGFKPRKDELLRIKRSAEEIALAPLFIDDVGSPRVRHHRARRRYDRPPLPRRLLRGFAGRARCQGRGSRAATRQEPQRRDRSYPAHLPFGADALRDPRPGQRGELTTAPRSTMAKKKTPAEPAINSIEALNSTVDNVAKLEVELRRLQAERDKEMQALREKHDGRIEHVEKTIKRLVALAETYCLAHRGNVFTAASKSAASALARFGFRDGNPSLCLLNRKWKWESVIEALRAAKLFEFLRTVTVTDVNKDKLKTSQLSDVELAAVGLRIDQAERFFVEPKSDDAARITTDSAAPSEA